MSLEMITATSPSNSAFRVVCGTLALNENYNVHHEAVFCILRNTRATLEIAGSQQLLKPDDIFFVSPNNKYKIIGEDRTVVAVVSLKFSNPTAVTQDYIPQSIIRALVNGNCSSYAVIHPGDRAYDIINGCMQVVTRAETEKREFFQLEVHAKMYEMFYQLFSNNYIKIIDAETKSKKYRALMRVTDYIDSHYNEGVSLEEVADATGISRYYVSHLFKELMGTTFVGYVNEKRLSHAAMLLVTSERPIIEIASSSGFNNLSNFNRAFKMYFDKTPSAYRKA